MLQPFMTPHVLGAIVRATSQHETIKKQSVIMIGFYATSMNCTLTGGPSDWDPEVPVLARPSSVGVTNPGRIQSFGDTVLLIIRYVLWF